MAIQSATRAFPWCMVMGGSGLLAAAQGWDSGVILTFVGGLGMAVMGIVFEYRRRSLESQKLVAQARADEIQLEAVARAAAAKVEAEAKVVRERLVLQAQIDNDKFREQQYAGTMTAQLAALQKSLDEGNRRVEEANQKLHSLQNEAQRASLAFTLERQELTKQNQDLARQLDELRHDYAELLVRMEGRIANNRRHLDEHDAQIADLKSATASGSGVFPTPIVVAVERNTVSVDRNTDARDANTKAVERETPPS